MRAAFGADEAGDAVVSLSRDGRLLAVIGGSSRADPLELLEAALKAAGAKKRGLREVAVDRGPDGFSAVRRRVAVAAGLALALKLPLAAVSGLTPAQAAALPSSDFKQHARIALLYAGAPNITTSKKKKTWTMR